MALTPGAHYSANWQEFTAWFVTDDDCRDYLDWLRWPDGFQCPMCGTAKRGWKRSDARWQCAECASVTSVTAGTVFDKTRMPLTLWFAAAWLMTQQSRGVSALGLKKELGLSSLGTAWHMLHRYRAAMARFDRPKLSGAVEVDETAIGGPRPGKRGRGAYGKTDVVIAVELEKAGFGRCRMCVLEKVDRTNLHRFIEENIEQGSLVITDGLTSYQGIEKKGYRHKAHNVKGSGKQAHELLPAVHRAAANLKSWITGTFYGSVSPEHMQSYLEEFTFRWNRRRSRKRGLLFYRLLECSVAAPPLPYSMLTRVQRKRSKSPTPPVNPQLGRREFQTNFRPWRTPELQTGRS